jgi:hypothetical protein
MAQTRAHKRAPRLRRLCFDTESDARWHYTWPWGDIPYRRAEIKTWKIRFDAGVVFDASTGRYHAFDADQADDLVSYLATADELVSFNGRRWDMLILENLCGEDTIQNKLWSKPHHDLSGWRGFYGLEDLSRYMLPTEFPTWGSLHTVRHQEMMNHGWTDWSASRVAKAWRDVHTASSNCIGRKAPTIAPLGLMTRAPSRPLC